MMRMSKYNPAQMQPSERAARFAGREHELDYLLEILRENIGRASKQHVLVKGPRGIGKTMLLLRVVDRLREDSNLSRNWFPIVASEEAYHVSSIGEFWLEMVFHLTRAPGAAHLAAAYENLKSQRDDRSLASAARGTLLDFADRVSKRLLLVVENLQMLFGEQMRDNDAWALRETLVGEPRIMLLASSVSLFEEIESPNAALYEQFLVYPLEPLDTEGCRRLWHAVTGKLLSKRRMRPFEILMGGNPRLLVIFSSFASKSSLRELLEDLVGLIDDHTDYLKSNTEALPALERKVFVTLAELWQDSTASEVADEARLDVNTTSAQLARLEKRGAVLSKRKGRTKRYRLAERLYNIYHLIRRRGDQQARVRAVVEFMNAYYGSADLPKRLQSIAEEALALSPAERSLHFETIDALISNEGFLSSHKDIVDILPPALFECPDIPAQLKQHAKNDRIQRHPPRKEKPEEISDEELRKLSLKELQQPDLLTRRGWLAISSNPDEAVVAARKALAVDHPSHQHVFCLGMH